MIVNLFRAFRLVAIAVAAVTAMASLLVGIFWYENLRRQAFEKNFSYLKSELPRYEKLANESPQLVAFGKIRPDAKLAIFCAQINENNPWPLIRQRNSLDPLMAWLPSKWIPAKANDVTTLVVLNWSQEPVGTYSDGTIGYQEYCQVDIVDLASQGRLASVRLAGGEPPARKRKTDSSKMIFGANCHAKILEYLEQITAKS